MKRVAWLFLSLAVLAADVVTKALVLRHIAPDGAIPVIHGFFQLVHVRNTGAAFGVGANSSSSIVPLLLNGGALAVFLVVLVYALRTPVTDRMLQTALHLILGGAVGNLLDRFRWGSVVDFLDVYVGTHHWPAFNVADSAICVGIGLLLLDMVRQPARRESSSAGA